MGFFRGILKGIRSVANVVGKGARAIGLDKVGDACDKVKIGCDILLGTKEKYRSIKQTKPIKTYDNETENGNDAYVDTTNGTESVKSAAVFNRGEIITEYQNRVAIEAGKRENLLKETFLTTYKGKLLNEFDFISTKEINAFIEKQSERFENVMRDEVNEKLSPKELKEMGEGFEGTKEAFNKMVNGYANTIRKGAEFKLLSLFEQVITETNKKIEEDADKYLKDENEALKKLKSELENLSQEGEKKDNQLKVIAEEWCSMEFIKNEAEAVA